MGKFECVSQNRDIWTENNAGLCTSDGWGSAKQAYPECQPKTASGMLPQPFPPPLRSPRSQVILNNRQVILILGHCIPLEAP